MPGFIVLSADEAAHVRGPASPPYALEPIERQGGVFILPADVLDHPAYAMHAEFLAARPQMDSADPSFPPALDPAED
ncbi:hypothetical protein [uncultured Reyranella sp.]|uniref:hypothetical protein n=1 Tax=uncultured Reyranella sp. TaxID=735512 RepID=UPI0025FE7C6B|nr:hypothetical protein [uncultured Reyranella sp.]